MNGLSLIELMTVISIVIALTTIATPFLGSLISRYQAESTGYHILATLKFCRVEALKREHNVTCSINASTQHKNVLTKVFLDNNNSNVFEEDTDILLSSSHISNTRFLQITPTESTWVYNRQGMSNNETVNKLQLCSLIETEIQLLNTIFIDPLGVIYMKEAAHNEVCT